MKVTVSVSPPAVVVADSMEMSCCGGGPFGSKVGGTTMSGCATARWAIFTSVP